MTYQTSRQHNYHDFSTPQLNSDCGVNRHSGASSSEQGNAGDMAGCSGNVILVCSTIAQSPKLKCHQFW
jgi:hypothetical protein